MGRRAARDLPDFATSGATLHSPVVARLVPDDATCQALLPDRSAPDVLALLGSLDAQAHRVATAIGGFWDGITDDRVPLPGPASQ